MRSYRYTITFLYSLDDLAAAYLLHYGHTFFAATDHTLATLLPWSTYTIERENCD